MIKAIIFDCYGVLYKPDSATARNDELFQLISDLRSAYRIGLLSNIDEITMARIISPQEQADLFDAVTLSGSEGVMKPDPLIYLRTASQLEIAPDECLMIDDSEQNCQGARAASMQSIQFHDNRQLQIDLRTMLTV